jgi:HemY protein
MRLIFSSFIVCIVLILLFFTDFVGDSGYVLINYLDLRFESTLWFTALLLLVAGFLVAIISAIIGSVFDFKSFAISWIFNRKKRKAQRLTHEALLAFLAEDWLNAEKKFAQAAPKSPKPIINYLYAAKSAHALFAQDRVDQYMAQAIALQTTKTRPLITKVKLDLSPKPTSPIGAQSDVIFPQDPPLSADTATTTDFSTPSKG